MRMLLPAANTIAANSLNAARPFLDEVAVTPLPGQDSNLGCQDQNLVCYHYTTGQSMTMRSDPHRLVMNSAVETATQ